VKFNELQIQSRQYALQGLVMGFLPLTVLACEIQHPYLAGLFGPWGQALSLLLGLMIPVLQISGIAMIFSKPHRGKLLVLAGMMLNTAILWFELINDALLTLFYAILSAGGLYYMFSARLYPAAKLTGKLQLNRFYGCCWGTLLLTLFSPLFAYKFEFFPLAVLINTFVGMVLLIPYLKIREFFHHPRLITALLGVVLIILLTETFTGGIVITALIFAVIALVLILRRKHADLQYLELILRHPARCLVLTFMALCAAGTLLLRTPIAMQENIPVIDAAFTAVSGACITGLTTIDVSKELTPVGRIFLLLLIQCGGLGIMTLATLALHALGKLSLNQELIFNEISGVEENDLSRNLRLIFSFTFIVELIGAFFLTWGFYSVHGNFAQALELGVFTSISAYCNAGIFPGEAGLSPYMNEGMLLLVIACQVVLGGVSPAVTFGLLDMRRKRQLPFISKLVLYSTGILLLTGAFFVLLFEWNGILGHLGITDKVINSIFLSASMRTAGFNAVDLLSMGVPAAMLTMALMFIGGSPGGTAGGIKTTTAAVLLFAFRAALRNEEQVVIGSRRVSHSSVLHALAVLVSAICVLFVLVLLLVSTQDISPGKLTFEAVSALSTVGLSLGITESLDVIGKIIIIIAMFVGRIGPLTLFLLLSDRHPGKTPGYPRIDIPLG